MFKEFAKQVEDATTQILAEGAVSSDNVFSGLEEYVRHIVSIQDAAQRKQACVNLAALAFLGFDAE